MSTHHTFAHHFVCEMGLARLDTYKRYKYEILVYHILITPTLPERKQVGSSYFNCVGPNVAMGPAVAKGPSKASMFISASSWRVILINTG